MSDTDDLDLVTRLLEAAGLQVDSIATGPTRRCDLRASDGRERYLIEVKGFHEDEAITKTLREGQLHESARSLHYSGSISNVIDDAVKQIEETLDRKNPELRLICLLACDKYDNDIVSHQIRAVLYGMRSLLVPATGGKVADRECLYFGESAFYRHRTNLDGAIVIAPDGAMICVNDHCSNVKRLRESTPGQLFVQKEAFHDEHELERRGCLIADCSIDRREEQRIHMYIEQKYGLNQTVLSQRKQHSVFVSVPDSPRPA